MLSPRVPVWCALLVAPAGCGSLVSSTPAPVTEPSAIVEPVADTSSPGTDTSAVAPSAPPSSSTVARIERIAEPEHQVPADAIPYFDPNNPDPHALRTQLIPIGFSKQGYFAYYAEYPDEAIGCYLWGLHIVDLESDRVVFERRVNETDCHDYASASDVLAKEGPALQAQLSTHGIEGRGSAAVSLPGQLDGHTFTARFAEIPVKSTGPMAPRAGEIFVSRDGVDKSVGKVEWYGFVGDSDLHPLALRSPYEARMAMLVPSWTRGWEGPPHVLRFHVVGVHLNERYPAKE